MPAQAPVRNDISVSHVNAPEPIEIHRGVRVTHPHPRHWHEEFHVCAVTGGGGYIDVKGVSHFTPKGTLIIVEPGEVHSNHATDGGCTYVNIYVPPELINAREEGVIQESHFPVLIENDSVVAEFVEMVNRLQSSHALERESALRIFFHQLAARYGGMLTPPQRCREANALRQVRDYLEDNFDREIALRELSELTNLSPYYVNRAFRLAYGIPPHAYLIQARIARAKRMLRQKWPIAHVAYRTGFADQAHLTRHFKRMVGVTPGQFAQDKIVQDSSMAAD
jgi:AraC-like DNA-binding protein